jgi:Tfp pilus assembly protein PilZ
MGCHVSPTVQDALVSCSTILGFLTNGVVFINTPSTVTEGEKFLVDYSVQF